MTTSPTLQNGAELKRLRIEAGLNRSELAGKAGLHQTYIGLLEREMRSARAGALRAIAGVLGCETRDLLNPRWIPAVEARRAAEAAKAVA